METQKISKADLNKIRGLSDFDLTMLISETHDHGWSVARCTLCQMPPANMAEFRRRQPHQVWRYRDFGPLCH